MNNKLINKRFIRFVSKLRYFLSVTLSKTYTMQLNKNLALTV